MSEHIYKVKWSLLCLLSFQYFSQNTRSFENWGTSLGFLSILAVLSGHIQSRVAGIYTNRVRAKIFDGLIKFNACQGKGGG